MCVTWLTRLQSNSFKEITAWIWISQKGNYWAIKDFHQLVTGVISFIFQGFHRRKSVNWRGRHGHVTGCGGRVVAVEKYFGRSSGKDQLGFVIGRYVSSGTLWCLSGPKWLHTQFSSTPQFCNLQQRFADNHREPESTDWCLVPCQSLDVDQLPPRQHQHPKTHQGLLTI